jgi:hypothetical protein
MPSLLRFGPETEAGQGGNNTCKSKHKRLPSTNDRLFIDMRDSFATYISIPADGHGGGSSRWVKPKPVFGKIRNNQFKDEMIA